MAHTVQGPSVTDELSVERAVAADRLAEIERLRSELARQVSQADVLR